MTGAGRMARMIGAGLEFEKNALAIHQRNLVVDKQITFRAALAFSLLLVYERVEGDAREMSPGILSYDRA